MPASPAYILVLYYSRFGATAQMAQRIARGVNQVDGVEAAHRATSFNGL